MTLKKIDYKEYARQMRENAVKNSDGNIICSPELWEQIASIVENTTTADVAPVVRCKDCKYAEVCETQCGAKYIECQSHEVYMEADDYCSYGERKENTP